MGSGEVELPDYPAKYLSKQCICQIDDQKDEIVLGRERGEV